MASNYDIPKRSSSIDLPSQNEKGEEIVRSLRRANERFGIPLNVSEVVERTLESIGFTQLQPPLTPTVEEWIAERMVAQGYAGYNHGSFVEDADGNLGFAKVHYGPDNLQLNTDENGNSTKIKVGGPEREARVLGALASNRYEVPKVLGYNPEVPEGASSAEADTYEVLVIEAILPEYGAVRKRESWTPDLSRIAARKIATFAKRIEEIPLFKDEQISLPVESLIRQLPTRGDEYDSALAVVLESYKYLDNPIVVHGDTWFNNIIARHDETDVMFVDWELAGPGYRGQDAGRKLWDLTLSDDWRIKDYSEAAQAFADEWSKTDDGRSTLSFGVCYESLRWISERMRDVNDPSTDEAARISLLQEIEDVKAHTLIILDNIK